MATAHDRSRTADIDEDEFMGGVVPVTNFSVFC